MAVNKSRKGRKGVAKIFDALMASIILMAIVSIASIHIVRTNHISSDTELELAASSIDRVIQDYERTGLIYYYVNSTDIQSLYNVLFQTLKDNTNSIRLNITLVKLGPDESMVVSTTGYALKDYVELSYFLTVTSGSEDNFYVLKVRIGYAEE